MNVFKRAIHSAAALSGKVIGFGIRAMFWASVAAFAYSVVAFGIIGVGQ